MLALVNTQTKQVVQFAATSFTVSPPLQWLAAPATATDATHTYDGTAIVVRSTPLTGEWFVLKATIRARLRAMGLETAADTARATLSASLQNQWNDAVVIHNDDASVISFLTAIGASPATVLAPDPDAALFFGNRLR